MQFIKSNETNMPVKIPSIANYAFYLFLGHLVVHGSLILVLALHQ